ncbi:SDR family oxidoreductase [Leptospira langatensis]|uniref:SDR family oxidoreductase n=1 Tax=Leptospira langatensis TaxID=2484983 RepID=A0A5F1ZPF3_9LEPT|nr:SDR family oxidoreductase [Leptospira langatensis]TGK05583.1 SDR family oxidoreductase [Leptospira langatensis]TGL38715.1 SDR family oxidoreductase [Leptospira langatensis]
MKQVLITGANRGIGLELSTLFAEKGYQVVAACRKASEPLRRLEVKIYEGLDLTQSQSFESLSSFLSGTKIDILINNAGILIPDNLESLDFQELETQILVNAIAPIRLTRLLLPKIANHGKIVFITSRMGSMGDNSSGAYYGYRMSKAALNAGAVSLARDLLPQKIGVGIYHPGMVATEMTGRQGISPRSAAEGLYHQIASLTLERSGRFFHQNGEELPW